MRDRPNDHHRKIASAAAGRAIKAHEVVDHIDGDKSNNRKENLRIMDRSKHSSMHGRTTGLTKLRSALRSFREGRKAY